ncbi:hypothetical protein HID58_041292 [Brassica napus]|uniref:Gnk2-homologous domain-containing protein n=1 Tax=Brassica napus TaxID=3708 RepID=A0ABQ8BAF8_BRANA|nr:hypothetical protein HID58_041292 [Brassica napus]
MIILEYEGRNFTSNTSYSINLNCLISSLPNLTPTINGFYNISIEGEVNAIALCRGDLKPNQDCINCITNTAKQLQESCQMEPVPFYHTSSNVSVADKESFSKGLGSKIVDAYDTSAGVKGIVYALAQCIPDLSKSDCRICLSQIFAGVPTCCDGQSEEKQPLSPPKSDTKRINGSKTLVFAVIPIVTIVLLVISLFIYLMRRKKNLKEEAEITCSASEFQSADVIESTYSLHFDFDTIRHKSGFGAVYKVDSSALFLISILILIIELNLSRSSSRWSRDSREKVIDTFGTRQCRNSLVSPSKNLKDFLSMSLSLIQVLIGSCSAWKNWVEERLMDLIDHRILQKDQQWISAVSMLSSDSESLQLPKPSQPGFFRRSMSFSIGHNVIIENCCLLCGQVGIAVKNIFRRFGYYVPLGGRDAVRDHVSIVSMVLRGFHRFKEKRFLVWLCSRNPFLWFGSNKRKPES